MNGGFDQRARTFKLQRTFGQSPAERARVAAENAQFADWWAQCKRCGVTRTGTIKDLTGQPCPTCGATSDPKSQS
jgi:rubrerythrin